ncbi:BrnT family toxin [Patescibacteria group bacterium]|nr:BrnT family toxin [Patescibacteria group bacterium]
MKTSFEWDEDKNKENRKKHGIDFKIAQFAFLDKNRVIAKDLLHGKEEERYYCFGKVKGGVFTVRFTYRAKRIRVIGAGYWRKGKKIYEKENQIHRRTGWGEGDQ